MMAIAVAVFFCVILLMPFTLRYARRLGAVDIPRDYRRMHKRPVPRNGGFAIGVAFLLGCALSGLKDPYMGWTLGGGFLLLLVGLIDDSRTLSPWQKLLAQATIAAVSIYGSQAFDWVAGIGAFLWILLLSNAHNFIDGLDGLFCGCAAIEAVTLSILLSLAGFWPLSQAALLLGVACLSFRIFNRHPACIFAGDCGSGSVGFWLGMLSFPLLQSGSEWPAWLASVLVFAYPLSDLFAAVMRRVLRGKSPFCADRGHFHHRICDAGVRAVTCCRILLSICAGFCGLSVLLSVSGAYLWGSIASCALAIFLIILRHQIVKQA